MSSHEFDWDSFSGPMKCRVCMRDRDVHVAAPAPAPVTANGKSNAAAAPAANPLDLLFTRAELNALSDAVKAKGEAAPPSLVSDRIRVHLRTNAPIVSRSPSGLYSTVWVMCSFSGEDRFYWDAGYLFCWYHGPVHDRRGMWIASGFDSSDESSVAAPILDFALHQSRTNRYARSGAHLVFAVRNTGMLDEPCPSPYTFGPAPKELPAPKYGKTSTVSADVKAHHAAMHERAVDWAVGSDGQLCVPLPVPEWAGDDIRTRADVITRFGVDSGLLTAAGSGGSTPTGSDLLVKELIAIIFEYALCDIVMYNGYATTRFDAMYHFSSYLTRRE